MHIEISSNVKTFTVGIFSDAQTSAEFLKKTFKAIICFFRSEFSNGFFSDAQTTAEFLKKNYKAICFFRSDFS